MGKNFAINMLVLDTNILIYESAGDPKIAAFLDMHSNDIVYIPTVVALEFLSYPLITQVSEEKFKNFLKQTVIVSLDLLIAETAAQLKRNYKLKLADTVVAASALITGASLITRNTRDFKKIKNLKLIEI